MMGVSDLEFELRPNLLVRVYGERELLKRENKIFEMAYSSVFGFTSSISSEKKERLSETEYKLIAYLTYTNIVNFYKELSENLEQKMQKEGLKIHELKRTEKLPDVNAINLEG